MESSLVIELKIACVDTGYFVGLTPAKNSQIQSGWVKRWIHMKDETRHMNFNNFAQRRHSSFIMNGRTINIKDHSLCL